MRVKLCWPRGMRVSASFCARRRLRLLWTGSSRPGCRETDAVRPDTREKSSSASERRCRRRLPAEAVEPARAPDSRGGRVEPLALSFSFLLLRDGCPDGRCCTEVLQASGPSAGRWPLPADSRISRTRTPGRRVSWAGWCTAAAWRGTRAPAFVLRRLDWPPAATRRGPTTDRAVAVCISSRVLFRPGSAAFGAVRVRLWFAQLMLLLKLFIVLMFPLFHVFMQRNEYTHLVTNADWHPLGTAGHAGVPVWLSDWLTGLSEKLALIRRPLLVTERFTDPDRRLSRVCKDPCLFRCGSCARRRRPGLFFP